MAHPAGLLLLLAFPRTRAVVAEFLAVRRDCDVLVRDYQKESPAREQAQASAPLCFRIPKHPPPRHKHVRLPTQARSLT